MDNPNERPNRGVLQQFIDPVGEKNGMNQTISKFHNKQISLSYKMLKRHEGNKFDFLYELLLTCICSLDVLIALYRATWSDRSCIVQKKISKKKLLAK